MSAETSVLLTEDLKEAIAAYGPRYPSVQAVLLPALHLIQQKYRCVPTAACEELAAFLKLAPAVVHDTATFYHNVFTREPIGRHRLWVCRSLSCWLRGGERLLDHLAAKLGVDPDQHPTTADGLFTLEAVECLGLCDGAPAMIVDGEVYTNLTEAQVDGIIERYRAGG